MNVAYLTPYLPWPADTGGKLRSFYLIQGLAKEAQVDLYVPSYVAHTDLGPLADLCRVVHVERMVWAAPSQPAWLRLFTEQTPRAVEHFQTPGSLSAIRSKLQQQSQSQSHAYDLLVCDEINMAPYVLDLPGVANIPKVIMRQKIDYLHYTEMADSRPWSQQKLFDRFEARRLRAYEYATMPRFDGAVVCSMADGEVARDESGGIPTAVIVNGADTDYFRPERNPDSRPTLILLGTMNYQPNIDAVQYYFAEMHATILAAIPDLQVLIVGHRPPPEIESLGGLPGITVTGSVPDVRPYLSRSWIMAVPLRLGGGTRLKIIEAMAAKLPVVSTSVGAQGLDTVHGQHIFLADDPLAFTRHCIDLLQNPTQGEAVAERAYAHIRAGYSWQQLGQKFADFCAQIAKISEGTHTDG
ncbi:MAG: glycosyltransferase [Caldilineaceae bacterium]|nr:glycosyltransferase [Caldilineaceae bacterium]MBP8106882.1 glycosyltransferase [Caldilineaceae bacterium]MBP8122428.1 glycosyltransferase [Caldilineaceae bacterium]MBP9072250.1 glycosyltransferase [Caldilineaceae bacterium]